MLKNLLYLTFFLSINTMFGQNLSVSTSYANQQGRTSEEISPSVLLKNNSGSSMELRWERVKNNMPSGWDALICERNCYSALLESRTFTLGAGESIQDFRVTFRPNGQEGIANAEIKVYEIKNPSNSVTVFFTASAVSGSSNGNGPSVYPNPAVDYIQIQDGSDVKFIEVHNALGRKILDFNAVNTGRYDIGDLPKGMYMVRMLDRNRNIIRTQRISKYNP
jgi:hypothetical protein